jgi:hypothetical protein
MLLDIQQLYLGETLGVTSNWAVDVPSIRCGDTTPLTEGCVRQPRNYTGRKHTTSHYAFDSVSSHVDNGKDWYSIS